jgi:hypothetical protein
MCFVFIWEQTATCATYSINWLVFITEMKSVYCAVRTGSLRSLRFVFKGLILIGSESFQHISRPTIYIHDKTWYPRAVWHCVFVYFLPVVTELTWSWPGRVETCKSLCFNKNIVLPNERLFFLKHIPVNEAVRQFVAVYDSVHRSFSPAGHNPLCCIFNVLRIKILCSAH